MKKVVIFLICLAGYLFIVFEIKAQVVINEFVPDSSQEWIELYNASESAEYLKSYYVDDDTDFSSDSGSSSKKLLTNLNTGNPTFPTIDTSSFLDNSGDWVVLFDQEGVLVDKYQFTHNPGKDFSIGRYPDLTGNFSILIYSTKADVNSTPPTPSPSPIPSLAPTPSETVKPTDTPTIRPAPTPTKKPTPFKTPLLASSSAITATTSASTSGVLGVQIGTSGPPASSSESPTDKKYKISFLPFIFNFIGLCFIAIPVFSIIKNVKTDYTGESEEQGSDII